MQDGQDCRLKGLRRPDREGLLRIGRVAEAAGVSVQTVHFYLREGLLTPPVKTARNMAYYDPVCIEEIRLIKELQATRYLPLSVIKVLLRAKREGQDPAHMQEMGSFLGDMFRPLEGGMEGARLSLAELADVSGLPVAALRELEGMRLLLPAEEEGDKPYDDADVAICKAVRSLLDQGVRLSDLAVYRAYVDAARAEATAVHDTVLHRLHDSRESSMADIVGSLNHLKACLATKVYRRTAVELHR